ncbi:MAG: bifunctional homocysteine S-methyltransferase/methylenetetrahydrofolate reductase [Anaerolineales bacterium]|jgi:homocysteine S-methyltransferase
MGTSKFWDLIRNSKKPVLADGAMGTMLHGRGIHFDQCFDELNLTEPEIVGEIHREYIAAGAQIIYTNTFGANRYKLLEHGLQNQVREINRAGVELAQHVIRASTQDVLVAGDVGPLGVRIAPFGRVKIEQAREAFAEQIQSLVDAGVDLLVLETMSDLHEIREAILAARALSQLPVVATMTFTRDDTTLLGDIPANVAQTLWQAGAQIIGINCSSGPAQALRILRIMQQAVPQARYAVKPNAGWPEQVGGRIMYPAGPEYFGEYAQAYCQAGVTLIGGCCGTTPAHIAGMRAALDTTCPEIVFADHALAGMSEEPEDLAFVKPTGLAQKLAAGHFTIAVEMDPPRGLSTHKMLMGASLLKDSGADVIDVADSPMARMRMSPWAVCDLLQRRVGVETTLHFPTRGRNLLRVQGDLLAAHALDIRNVFVVMGDPTAIGDYPDAMDDYDLVPSGLIKLIKQGFNAGVDHAGATIGSPTTFFVGCALDLTPKNMERETRNLRRKLEAGTDFVLTQPIYEAGKIKEFVDFYTSLHGPLQVPVLVGVLPLYGTRHAAFLHNEVPGISIPAEIIRRLEAAGDEAPTEGVRIAVELIEQIRPYIQGIYIMPAFGRYDLVAEIIEAVRTPEPSEAA